MFFRNDCPKSVLLASLALFLAGCGVVGGGEPSTDTDSDGFSDAEEMMAGSDPNNALSTPNDIDADGVANDMDTNPRLFDRTLIGANDIDDTASVNAGDAGFTLSGVAARDDLGYSVSGAGDVNGDGIDDVIAGANGASSSTGAAYVIYGKADGSHMDIALATDALAAEDGFRILGAAARDYLGDSVSAAGDVNGDGMDDLIVGAIGVDAGGSDAGAAYVIYGQDSTVENYVDRGDLNVSAFADTDYNGADGFRILGAAAGDEFGNFVSGAGDVNGDGMEDLIVGELNNDAGGSNAGAAYVIYGQDSVTRGNIDVGDTTGDAPTFPASAGFRILGAAAGDEFGNSVSGAGDVNGDGIDDVIVGARYNEAGGSNAGAAYVIYGQDSTAMNYVDRGNINVGDTTGDAPTFPASAGFRILGAAAGDYFGWSVSGAGDVNGDGLDDVIVGAWGVSSNAGAAYVIYGQDSTVENYVDRGNIDVGDAPTFPASAGFRILGAAAEDRLGNSVSGAGDVNGDGFSDVIVGAPYNDAGDTNVDNSNTGVAYVIYAQDSTVENYVDRGDLNVGSLAADDGFRLLGAAEDSELGISVSGAGDVNGDGMDDVIVGANGVSTGTGAAYVLLSPTPVE